MIRAGCLVAHDDAVAGFTDQLAAGGIDAQVRELEGAGHGWPLATAHWIEMVAAVRAASGLS